MFMSKGIREIVEQISEAREIVENIPSKIINEEQICKIEHLLGFTIREILGIVKENK